MSDDDLRYRCIEEDDGTVTVWDNTLNAPAHLAGQELSHRLRNARKRRAPFSTGSSTRILSAGSAEGAALALGIAAGIGLGAVFGIVAFDNAAIGIAMGIAVGAAGGYILKKPRSG